MRDLIDRQATIDARRYTFGNDEFSLEAAYHDCKLVFDGITDDDSFQEADTGLILYYANEIIYALHEALEGKDKDVPMKRMNDLPSAQPEPKWIPCSERLPDKINNTYWVCLESGGQCQCRWTNDMYGLGANEFSEWGWHIMDKPQYSKVISWRELPEPYHAERREDDKC